MINYKFIEKKFYKILKISQDIQNEIPIVCMMIDKYNNEFITVNHYDQHAEIIMINKFQSHCRNSMIFVNVEPCPMCLFAFSLQKVKYVFFGTNNKLYGAAGGKFYLHQFIEYKIPQTMGGFLEKENSQVIKNYFLHKR